METAQKQNRHANRAAPEAEARRRLVRMVAKSIVAGEPKPEVAKRAIDEIGRLIPRTCVTYWLRSSQHSFAAVYSVSDAPFPSITGLKVDVDSSSTEQSANTIVVDDCGADARIAALPHLFYLASSGTRGYVQVALTQAGKALGWITLASQRRRTWTEFEVSLIEDVADALAIGLLKEQAEQTREEATARLRVISMVATSITSGEKVGDVAKRALADVLRFVPGTRLSYWLRSAGDVFAPICSVSDPSLPPIAWQEIQADPSHLLLSTEVLVIRDCSRESRTERMARS